MRSLRRLLGGVLVWSSTVGAALAAPTQLHLQQGPAVVKLASDIVTMKVPEGCSFANKADTEMLIRSAGTKPDGSEVGAVLPSRPADKEAYAILLRYQAIGYVKDNDAAKLDPESMLADFKEGTEQANKEREASGHSPIHVTRWAQTPTYDAAHHFITYALEGTSKDGTFLNCDTQMLSRHGILTLKLITDQTHLAQTSQIANTICKDIELVPGERYADYKPGTDKDSGLGLRELVLGGAGLAVASKLGLLAKFGKLILWVLVAFKKLGVLLVAAVVSLFKKLTGAKSESDQGGSSPNTPS
jgi:uncharacterized membrane-anchored protein